MTVEPLTAEAPAVRVPGGRQHEHRDERGLELRAEAAADLEAVDPGEHDVEHDRVVGARVGHPESLLARRSHVGRMALFCEPPCEQPGQLRLVLDDQDAHLSTNHPRGSMREA